MFQGGTNSQGHAHILSSLKAQAQAQAQVGSAEKGRFDEHLSLFLSSVLYHFSPELGDLTSLPVQVIETVI